MPLRIKRGTNNQRLQYTPAEGELLYTTDDKQMWVGDGVTQGGIAVGGGAGGGAGGSLTSNIDLNGRSITGIGTISINGNISGSNIFGNLSGNVTSNILTGGSIRITSNTISTTDSSTILINQKTSFQEDLKFNFDLISNDGTIVFKNSDKILSNGTLNFESSKITSDNVFVTPGNNSVIGILELGSVSEPLQIRTYWKDPNEPLTKTYGLTNGVTGITNDYFGFRNTFQSPAQTITGDCIAINQYHGWTGTQYARGSAVWHGVDPFAFSLPQGIPGTIALITDGAAGSNIFSMDSRGYIGINQFPNRAAEALDVNGNAIIRGTLKAAAFKGSLFGDDSTVIVDGINRNINSNIVNTVALYSQISEIGSMVINLSMRVDGSLTFANLSTVQRDALVTVSTGTVIYNTNSNNLQIYQNGSWSNISTVTPETDPSVPSHVKAITTTEISNWNTAYGWGNHASAGYLTAIPATLKRDLVGSVFADDSSLIIDGVNGKIVGDVQNNEVVTSILKGPNGSTLNIESQNGNNIEIGYQNPAPANIYIGVTSSTITRMFSKNILINTSNIPTSSKGQAGDENGFIAIDSNYLYYCTATYDSTTDIWKRVALTGGIW